MNYDGLILEYQMMLTWFTFRIVFWWFLRCFNHGIGYVFWAGCSGNWSCFFIHDVCFVFCIRRWYDLWCIFFGNKFIFYSHWNATECMIEKKKSFSGVWKFKITKVQCWIKVWRRDFSQNPTCSLSTQQEKICFHFSYIMEDN